MPGFVINGTGGETNFGGGPAGNLEVRRTHRWVFETLTPLEGDVRLVLKSASRPEIEFEAPEMFHNQERVYLAGQHTWSEVSMSWYDVEQDPDVSKALWDWLNGAGLGGGPFSDLPTMKIKAPKDYKRDASLVMVDGMGDATERWKLYQGWPKKVNWNSLDYSSSDLQLIELTYRYDRAVREEV